MNQLKNRLTRVAMLAATIMVGGLATACLGSVGQPCTSSADCLTGEVCLTEAEGFPGGYCTVDDCLNQGCPELSSECFNFDINGESRFICLAFCDSQSQCSRAGYDCFDVDNSQVCLPGDGAGGNQPRVGEIGSSCTESSQCDEDVCLSNLPSGYCSANCSSDGDCPTGSHCEMIGSAGFCYDDCENQADCRSGYDCALVSSGTNLSDASCVEAEDIVVRNPNGSNDGETCVTDIGCRGGVCSRAAEGYPGGYCSTLNCDNDNGCNGGVCTVQASNTVCKAPCSSDNDCRSGYECINGTSPSGSVVQYCQPPAGTTGGGTPTTTSEIEIDCQSGSNLTFTVPSGSPGFYIAPFSENGADVLPQRLIGDNGVDIDLINEFSFYSLNPQLLVSIAPLLFPGSDETQFEGARTDWGGTYTLSVQSSASEMCYYILPKTAPGNSIDINFYLVGAPVTAANARNDADFQEMIEAMRRIYGDGDISIGETRFFELSAANEQRYSILRDFNDIFRLVALSEDPGPSVDDRLSVNVFLIRDFSIPEVPGLLGISPGLPGVSGFHGTTGAGLIFSSVNLTSSPGDLGQTMAHEIGHFLGLRHTTEHGGDSHDPISDTPECSNPENGTACPDSNNFMFPFSISGVAQESISTGQSYVLRRSALVK